MSKKILFLRLSFLLLTIHIIKTQEIKELELEREKTGSLNSKENAYYSIKIPSNITSNTKYLLLSLSPNSDLDKSDNIFSDPNIYISKKEKYPNPQNSEWKSEIYGDDIISIGSENINPNDIFYININCESKCNYKLNIYLQDKYNIKENIFYSIILNEGESIKIEFTSRENYKELFLSCIGLEMIPFRIYLNQKNPSSSNTYSSFPIYTNGYRFIIKEGDENYFTNSKYEILIENKGETSLNLKLYLNYDREEETLKEFQSIYDSAEKYFSQCYNFKISDDYKNKDLIISIMLFSGNGIIQIGGYNSIKEMKYNEIPFNDLTYDITNDKVIKLTKKNFKTFEGKFNNFIYFCFFASETSSYVLKTYFLENTQKMQNLNYLFPGKYLNEYLPYNQITQYKTELFKIEKDINIIHEKKRGKSKLYVYYCKEEYCEISEEKLEELKEKNKLIESEETFKGSEIKIKKKENECLKNLSKKCILFIIIYCEENDLECEYKIGFDHDNTILNMQPRTFYKNVITENEEDKYRIDIYDNDIKNFAIILNQNTGKTDLSVYKFSQDEKEKSLIDIKLSKDFLPNVINVQSDKLKVDNLKGSYYIKVTGRIFSSYTLYYYTYEESDNLEHKTISMKLELGKIIQDFFPDKTNIKIYSFENKLYDEEKKNLFISLTKINVDCTFYIFKDLDDYKLDKKLNSISGYIYKSNYNNELLMKSSDSNYISNKIFYIMVVKNRNTYSNPINSENTYTSYHIGITDEDTPFILNEGIQQRIILNKDYNKQKYYYNHRVEKNNSLIISIYTSYGRINPNIVINNKNYTVQESNELLYIKLDSKEIENYCEIPSNCKVELTLYKNDYYNTNYLIVCKSSINSPEIITPGQIIKKSIFSGEYQYYIIETIPDENLGIRINTLFFDGYGEIYVNTNLNKSDLENNFPTKDKCEYSNTDKYNSLGQNLIIPYEDIKTNNLIRLYITIYGNLPSYSGNRIEYIISFSNLINNLETNKNYQFSIGKGEFQYFRFNINKRVKRLYITMSNKKSDADLYLNYGKKFPTIKIYDWKSTGGYNEFLDVSKDDNYFSKLGLNDIIGEYSLMIKSFGESTYNLFISSEDVKLLHISENSPNGCYNEQNDICYFRFENINDFSVKDLKEKEILFYIEYTFGSGKIYANLFENGNYDNIMKNLPYVRKYEYTNEKSYSFLKIKLDRKNTKYTINSVIIVGVQCIEKCLFDMSVTQLKTNEDFGSNKYLSLDKENIFYLSPNDKKDYIFSYYFYNTKNLNYEIRSYQGKGFVRTYVNGTIYNYTTKTSVVDYHHISDFEINEEKENSISKSISYEIGKSHYVYFQVKPKNDLIFFIHINFANEWTKIPIGKISNHIITKNNFYCYFDLLEEFDEVVVSINNELSEKKIKFYSKMNILSEDKLNQDYHYSVPSSSNFDFKGESNNILSSVSFKVKNIPKDIRNNIKVARMLLLINLDNFYYGEEKISILISPNVNNYQRIISEQGTYYFSSLSKVNKDKTIFNLVKKNKFDDLMIIEVSSCQGDFSYSLTDTISSTKENSKENNIKSNLISSNGKKIIIIKDLKEIDYYLYIWGTKEDDINCILNKENCKDIELLMYYYTTKSNLYNQTISNSIFEYENIGIGKILIQLPKIYEKNAFGTEENILDLDIKLVYTKKSEEFKYFESTCYLTKKLNSNSNENENEIKYTIDKIKNTMTVSGLTNKEKYYMNILINNKKSGEIYTLKPIQVIPIYSLSLGLIIILIIIIIIICGVAFYFYKKFKTTKEILNYEVNDIRNLGSIPKTISEMREIALDKEKSKYASLTEDINEI